MPDKCKNQQSKFFYFQTLLGQAGHSADNIGDSILHTLQYNLVMVMYQIRSDTFLNKNLVVNKM